jgi:hypothetical protein
MNGRPRENWTCGKGKGCSYMIMSEHKDNLLILPKSLFRVGKVVTWAEPGIKGGWVSCGLG